MQLCSDTQQLVRYCYCTTCMFILEPKPAKEKKAPAAKAKPKPKKKKLTELSDDSDDDFGFGSKKAKAPKKPAKKKVCIKYSTGVVGSCDIFQQGFKSCSGPLRLSKVWNERIIRQVFT